MARFDVFRNTGEVAASVPLLLDVQSDVLSSLDTRIVIPIEKA
ncbi:MAG: CcdB protein [Pseudomonadota bacterium]|jgi:toxin CcdB